MSADALAAAPPGVPAQRATRIVFFIAGFGVGGQWSAIDAERYRNEAVAKQQCFHLAERQHADDRAVAFGKHVVCVMAEAARDDVPPGGAMEEAPFGMGEHEGVPGRLGRWRQFADGDAHAAIASGTLPSSWAANTRSIRSQAKSVSNRSSRPDIASRLR